MSLFSMPFCGMFSSVPSGSLVEKKAPSPDVSIDGIVGAGVRWKIHSAISARAMSPMMGHSQRFALGTTGGTAAGMDATAGARPKNDRMPAGR